MSNLTSKDLYGSMTALVTPMLNDGNIDLPKWKALIYWQIKSQTIAIVVAGTTGESALLNNDEFQLLLETAVECCKDTNTSVIAGTGHTCTDNVVVNNDLAYKCGAQAVLVVTPYYIRTTQQGLIAHFNKIADKSKLPVILYNVPSRTHNDMLAKTSIKLANHRNIIGIKEASVDENRITELLKGTQASFTVLSGNDDMFCESLQQGAVGVISVASNLRPLTINKICTLMALGDVISAKKLNSSLDNLYKMLSYQPNPIPVKYMLHKSGLIGEGIRLPLVWFDGNKSGLKPEIKKITEEYSKI